MNLCACGCGQETTIFRGKPNKFIHGHNLRLKEKRTNPLIKCACGCGQTFPKYNKWGRETKYVSGHTSKSNLLKIIPPKMRGTIVNCECGCGEELIINDKTGRSRRFIYGHFYKKFAASGENHTQYKGGFFISKNKKQKMIGAGKNPRFKSEKYVSEARIIMEKHLGRELTFNDIIFYKDGNRLNTLLDNLEVITRSQNFKRVYAKKREGRFCIACGSEQTRMYPSSKYPIWHKHQDGVNWVCDFCYHQTRMHYNSKVYRMLENNTIKSNYQNIRKLKNNATS